MQQLIAQVREAIPFDLTDEQICADSCQGCSVKLLAFLEQELETWEHRGKTSQDQQENIPSARTERIAQDEIQLSIVAKVIACRPSRPSAGGNPPSSVQGCIHSVSRWSACNYFRDD
jgi:hypothetical protein